MVYDPKVKPEQIYANLDFLGTRNEVDNRKSLKVIETSEEACIDAHAVAVLTEWEEFKEINWQKVYDNMLKPALLFDGRRILKSCIIKEAGFEYYSIGR